MDSYKKYLKYKNKYLFLLNGFSQTGGKIDSYLFNNYYKLQEDDFIKVYYDKKVTNIVENKEQIYSDNFIKNLKLLYEGYLTKKELELIDGKLFTVKLVDGVKEERDEILIPCFYHENTKFFLNNLKIENIDLYFKRMERWFNLTKYLRENLSFEERQGCMFDSSFVQATYDVRNYHDIDTIIVPTTDREKYQKICDELKKNELIDLFMDKFVYWDGEDLDFLIKQNIKLGFPENYFELILNPKYHFYFYGFKVNTIYFDLKYRKNRGYPKNYVDLMLFKKKYNFYKVELPEIAEETKVGDKIYNRKKYFHVVNFYTDKFEKEKNEFKSLKSLYNNGRLHRRRIRIY
jgi:hypothetical protein